MSTLDIEIMRSGLKVSNSKVFSSDEIIYLVDLSADMETTKTFCFVNAIYDPKFVLPRISSGIVWA